MSEEIALKQVATFNVPGGDYFSGTSAPLATGGSDAILFMRKGGNPADGPGMMIRISNVLDPGARTFTTISEGVIYMVRDMHVADFNKDGREDYFYSTHGLEHGPMPAFEDRTNGFWAEYNGVLLNSGNGTFALQQPEQLLSFSHGSSVIDFDNDGDLDIFVNNLQASATVLPNWFLENDGSGKFTVNQQAVPDYIKNADMPTTSNGFWSASGDFNGDGYTDLFWSEAVIFGGPQGLGSGGTLVLPKYHVAGYDFVQGSAVGDLNHDGIDDLVLDQTPFGQPGAHLQLLMGAPTGALKDESLSRIYGGGLRREGQAGWKVLDINGDGHPDLVPIGPGPVFDQSAIYINDGEGYFTARLLPVNIHNLLIADFDGDGSIELLAIHRDWFGRTLDGVNYEGENYAVVYQLGPEIGTGPMGQRDISHIAPGYNEQYYLRHNPEVQTAVNAGQFQNGLDHYLQVGRAEGRASWAPHTLVKASSSNDTLVSSRFVDFLDGGAGSDTVSYAFQEGGVFVNLTLGRGWGNAAQGDTYISIENVIGTAYNDFIIGDTGVNRLDGGAGNDTIIGAVGADVLIGGSGIDTASYEDNSGSVFVNLTLNAGSNNAAHGDSYDGIENLVGGLFDDFFIGDEQANRLDGAMGADTLLGAGGADTFVFKHAPGVASGFTHPNSSANVDTILDFTTGVDKIELSSAAFSGLGLGTLNPGAFVLGTAALDADDRIIYDQATGNLWFDADGSGSGQAILFAVLDNKAPLAATDFAIAAP